MPYWLVIFDTKGGMPGLRGPYSGYEAQRKKEKLESAGTEDCEIVSTISHNSVKAKREIKEKLIEAHGYTKGSKRIQRPIKAITTQESY